MGNGCNPLGSEWTMAHLEDMRLPVVAREALVDDPSFLRDLVEAVLNRFLDAEITEHLQAGPYERSEGRAGYRNGYRSRQLKTRVGTCQRTLYPSP
jgi:putative transposase